METPKGMIVITGVTLVKVPGGVAEITFFDAHQDMFRPELYNERVEGEFFRNDHGQTVCIGASKEVQETLGLPFAAFRNMQQAITREQKINSRQHIKVMGLKRELRDFNDIGFWGLVSLAFTKLWRLDYARQETS